ncbi:hypothetical protein ACQY1Q_05340 [Tenacibaculum sp. TC6]|uniref:hypothetical protein n=1 Tax=Tenacibaculum sp. TC6 TaxID=3423223 RepID=UPI003D36D545
MKENETKSAWSSKDQKSLTEDYINHVYHKYYLSYRKESEYYEKINNHLFITITIIGFVVTIILGLKGFIPEDYSTLNLAISITAFILPSVSSVLILYINQKGFKQKEELREMARIECKHLVNKAKIIFSRVKDNPDELEKLYLWLSEQVKQLQMSQARGYFSVHNITDQTTEIKYPTEV